MKISGIQEVYKKKKQRTDLKFIWIPVLLFFVIGIIDSLVKYSQSNLDEKTIPLFTMITFGIAGHDAVVFYVHKDPFHSHPA